MIVQYVREKSNIGKGKPIGVIVAIRKNKLGWSFCSKKDLWDRELGKKIASGRALKNECKIFKGKKAKNFSFTQKFLPVIEQVKKRSLEYKFNDLKKEEVK